MDIQSSVLTELFVLYPVIIQGWVTPVKPYNGQTAHGGIPKVLYDDHPEGLECLIDPWTEMQLQSWTMAVDDRVDICINDNTIPVVGKTVQPGEETQRQRLFLPHELLVQGINEIYYIVTRASGNTSEESRPLRVLYHLRRAEKPQLILPPDVIRDGVSAARAAQGVEFEFTYINWRPHDRIRCLIGDSEFWIDVPEGGVPFKQKMDTDRFRAAGDNPSAVVEFYVADQLNNRSSKSPEIRLDIHLNRVDQPAPAFINGPYRIGPGGRLKDVVIRAGTASEPIANAKVSVLLPPGFSYSDASTGEREFITDAHGLITVLGLKGSNRPGEAKLEATHANQTGTASVVIAVHGPLGRIEAGPTPYMVAVSHDGLRAYVTCPPASLIIVIDTSTNRAATYFSIGKRCDYLAVSPDDSILYASNVTSASVSFIDTATGAVVHTVNTAPNPTHVTLNSSGTELQVSHESLTTVTLINIASRVARPVAVNERPQGGVFSNDGKLLYVCIYHPSNLISVIDTQSQRVIANIAVAKGPWRCVLSPDDRYLYVSHQDSNQVSVIDTATRRVIRTLNFASYAMDIVMSADGAFLYVSLWTSQIVVVIDTTTWATRNIPAAGYLRGLALTPDESRLYVCDSGANGSTVEALEVAPSISGLGSMSLPELEFVDPHRLF